MIFLLSTLFVVLASNIGDSVPIPKVFNVPPTTVTHSLWVGSNNFQFKPQIESTVYNYKIVGQMPEGAKCQMNLPELQTQKVQFASPLLTQGQFIESAIVGLPNHSIYILTNKGRLAQYSSKKDITFKHAQAVTTSKAHLFKNQAQQLFLSNETGTYRINVQSWDFNLTLMYKQPFPNKIVHHRGQIISLFNNSIHIWSQYTQNSRQIKLITDSQYVDFDVSNGNVVVLSSGGDIAISSIYGLTTEYFSIDAQGFFKKLRIHNQTIFLIYEQRKTNYVVELFYTKQELININKIYRRLGSVQDFSILQYFAVFMGDYVTTFVEHSINRNIQTNASKELLWRTAMPGAKIVLTYGQGDSFVLFSRSKIQLFHIERMTVIPTLHCQFESAGQHTITIQYAEASCKQSANVTVNPRNAYCLHTVNYHFFVEKHSSALHIIFINIVLFVILVAALIVLLLILQYCRNLGANRLTSIENYRQRMERRRAASLGQQSSQI